MRIVIMLAMEYQVLLYYKYIEIKDPQAVMLWQKMLCDKLRLKGRIIIAHEGINGTVEGLKKDTITYMREMKEYESFKEIQYKKSVGTGKAFKKLSVKVRKDIVSDTIADWKVDPTKKTGKYLKVEKLHQWIKSKKDIVIIDMRNDYEHKSGHFEGAILLQMETFRDLPKVMPQLQQYAQAACDAKKLQDICSK